MSIIDLESLKKNDFQTTGIKGVAVVTPNGSQPIVDERANAWTVEDGNLHLWKVAEANDGKPVPTAHLASYAQGSWVRAYLVSEL